MPEETTSFPDHKPRRTAPCKAVVVGAIHDPNTVCDLLDIEHPIALGGMGSATSPALVAAVSRAGGLGLWDAITSLQIKSANGPPPSARRPTSRSA